MLIHREIRLLPLFHITWKYFAAMAVYATAVVLLFQYAGCTWLRIPWSVLAVVGTAVAFYLGFKNNSSYDRQWEARKIWGAIVNSSRAWGIMVMDYVSDQFVDGSVSADELHHSKRELMHRLVAWLYCLRRQLWKPKPWEHKQNFSVNARSKYCQHFSKGSLEDEIAPFLTSDEFKRLLSMSNPAAQMIAAQSNTLKVSRGKDWIDDFRHMEMGNILVNFYEQQGKCERIKNFPLPRQYANTSFIFVIVFLILLPFGIVTEFATLGEYAVWLTVPFSLLIGWVYWLMEMVGDYAENPFEGLALDTPMTSLCRMIEIDLREMLGETDLPPPIEPIDGVLL